MRRCASGRSATAVADRARRCRRRSIRSRSRPTARSSPPAPTARFICLSATGELHGEVAGGADADHRGRDVARRHARRRRRHPRLGGDHRSQHAQARAHAGRPRPAGLVGGVLSRQPHAAHRRHRPHDPPLGRGQRRAGRRRWSWARPDDPLAAYADDPGAQVFRACVACHTLQRRRRQPRRPDAGRHFRAPDRDPAGLQFLRRR